jgi:hypothetical protein
LPLSLLARRLGVVAPLTVRRAMLEFFDHVYAHRFEEFTGSPHAWAALSAIAFHIKRFGERLVRSDLLCMMRAVD